MRRSESRGAGIPAAQAVEQMRRRVKRGAHDVAAEDLVRRHERGRRHLVDDSLPLADEWGVGDKSYSPPHEIVTKASHTLPALRFQEDGSGA